MKPIIPEMLSPTEAAAALGIEVVDLAITCRSRAAQKLAGIARDVEGGHPLDEDELAAALRLVAAAEACDEVWQQDNPEELDED
jgi:hypothetical protein